MQTLHLFKIVSNFILEIFFPVYCPGCNKKGEILCENCLLNMKLADRQTEEGIVAIFDYRESLAKNIIWHLKYHGQKYLGQKLGQVIYEYTKDEIASLKTLSQGKQIMVIPVPVSRKRLRERGYNHSELLALGFYKENEENLEFNNNLVIKNQETEHQAKITNKSIRLKNIRNSFVVNPKLNIKGRTIVIIDDVTTTGGTFLEISRVLKKAGAKKIMGFALAH
jgi:ComF family protein